MENLKFHNTVGTELEKLTGEMGTNVFTQDQIDSGLFIDAMLNVLRINPQKLTLYTTFLSKCNEYYGKRKYDIPDDEAMALYDTFKAIIDK